MKQGSVIISLQGKSLDLPIEKEIIRHPHVTGVILFTKNYESKEQLKKLTSAIKEEASKVGKNNFFIVVDQEGGKVQRFRSGFTQLPAPKEYGEAYEKDTTVGLEMAYNNGRIMAEELLECGVDLSLAPVADLDAGNEVIGGLGRAFHSDPDIAIELISKFIEGMYAAGMRATLKHFPGHGRQGIGDSHKVRPEDDRSYEELLNNDLKVFAKLIKDNHAHAIMSAHIIYSAVDPDHTAGASEKWLSDILRKQLGFKGIIISDCLSMEGSEGTSWLEKVELSLKYGDIALFCDQTPEVFLDVLNNLQYEQSVESINRIREWIVHPSPGCCTATLSQKLGEG